MAGKEEVYNFRVWALHKEQTDVYLVCDLPAGPIKISPQP